MNIKNEKSSPIKSRKLILIKTASLLLIGCSLVTYNIISTRTSWFHPKPLWCGIYNPKLKQFKELPVSSELTDEYHLCLKEVYRPFSFRMGDIRLGLWLQKGKGPAYYFDTTFWMASNLGELNFTDQTGDFSNHSISLYSSQGILKKFILDTPLGWSDLEMDPESFSKLCKVTPFFLNDLHLSDSCRDAQIATWKRIKSEFTSNYKTQFLSLDKIIIQKAVNNLVFIFIAVLIFSQFSSTTKQVRIIVNNKNSPLAKKLKSIAIGLPWKIFSNLSTYGTISILTIIIIFGLITSKTNWMKPAPFLCKSYTSNLTPTISQELYNQFYMRGHSDIEICFHELLTIDNKWNPAIELGVSFSDYENIWIYSDLLFWIQSTDELDTDFSNQEGDFRYSSLESFNKYGIKTSNIPSLMTFSTWYAQILPDNIRTELWNEVNTLFRDNYRGIRLSFVRKLYNIFYQFLPLLLGGVLLAYIMASYLELVLINGDEDD